MEGKNPQETSNWDSTGFLPHRQHQLEETNKPTKFRKKNSASLFVLKTQCACWIVGVCVHKHTKELQPALPTWSHY